ncbi:hypothetical protein AB0N17_22320 [Streptomyces sp. NPDC051133]|uniref:hypothetical protein n=1 Tax=Streptomyces sp. NPDC051133 TaxID=3155521 RepID=UPI00341393B5
MTGAGWGVFLVACIFLGLPAVYLLGAWCWYGGTWRTLPLRMVAASLVLGALGFGLWVAGRAVPASHCEGQSLAAHPECEISTP